MAGSGDGARAMAVAGVGESTLLRSLDYPCTERLRLCRLLAYLRRHGHIEVYDVYAPIETPSRFCLVLFIRPEIAVVRAIAD